MFEHKQLFYSINELCRAVGLGRTTIYKAIASGELVAVKAGRRTLIPATAVDNWAGWFPGVFPGEDA